MFYELAHLASADYFKKIHGSNFSFPPHMHNCFEAVFCLSGNMNITVDNREYVIKKGEAVLIFPNQIHSFGEGECSHMLCIFSPRLVAAFFAGHSSSVPAGSKFTPSKALGEMFINCSEASSKLFKKGMLYLLCDEFDKEAEYVSADDKTLLHKIFLFANDNFTGDCSITALSTALGRNSSYISRYFKACVGINLCDYINILRLGNMCYLYENGEGTILDCALSSGFDSLRTFNRNFKKFYNMPPKEYFKSKK